VDDSERPASPSRAGHAGSTAVNIDDEKAVLEGALLPALQPSQQSVPAGGSPTIERSKTRGGLTRKGSMFSATKGPLKKEKIVMGLTGANRQLIRDDEKGRAKLDALIKAVNVELEMYNVEIIPYSPEDKDEAMYELCATEWLVQWGDLGVAGMTMSPAYRTLSGGRDTQVSLEDVQEEYKYLRADSELKRAFCAAGKEDDESFRRQNSDGKTSIPLSVRPVEFYNAFDANPALIRALVRSRMFTGTLSAGSGSCQMTLRSTGPSVETSQVHSVPLGNRTPLVSMEITDGVENTLFGKHLGKTRELAQELLLDGPIGKCKATRPAWSEDGPVDKERLTLWYNLLQACADERGFASQKRGLFVGISAIFYAAKLAGCDQMVLERDAFIAKLDAKRDALLAKGGTDGRGLANLTLVMALVDFSLHRSAKLVCKRNWKVGPANAIESVDFVATWTLGMYLKHSGVMGIPLYVEP